MVFDWSYKDIKAGLEKVYTHLPIIPTGKNPFDPSPGDADYGSAHGEGEYDGAYDPRPHR